MSTEMLPYSRNNLFALNRALSFLSSPENGNMLAGRAGTKVTNGLENVRLKRRMMYDEGVNEYS